MTRDELIAEIERNPADVQQTMLETFAEWCDERGMNHREITRAIADACAAYFDVIEAL